MFIFAVCKFRRKRCVCVCVCVDMTDQFWSRCLACSIRLSSVFVAALHIFPPAVTWNKHALQQHCSKTAIIFHAATAQWSLPAQGWGCSSLGRVSDWRATDVGSISQCGKGFFSIFRVNLQCRLSYGLCTPHVQLHAFTSVRTLKILYSMSEFNGLWKHWIT